MSSYIIPIKPFKNILYQSFNDRKSRHYLLKKNEKYIQILIYGDITPQDFIVFNHIEMTWSGTGDVTITFNGKDILQMLIYPPQPVLEETSIQDLDKILTEWYEVLNIDSTYYKKSDYSSFFSHPFERHIKRSNSTSGVKFDFEDLKPAPIVYLSD